MARIFISYSRADRQFIDQFVPLVRKVYGNDTLWFDDDIHGGTNWWQMILDEVADCDLYIFLVSNESLESPYCQAELHEALRLNKQILPVIVRRLNPPYPGNIEPQLAEVLHKTQYVDMSRGFRDPAVHALLYGSINRLFDDVSKQRRKPERSTPTPEPPVRDKPVSRGNNGMLRLMAIILLIGIVIAGIFGLWQFIATNETKQEELSGEQHLQTAFAAQTHSAETESAFYLTATENILLDANATQVAAQFTQTENAAQETLIFLSATPTHTPLPTNTPRVTLANIDIAIARAWNFINVSDTRNNDWEPYIHTFDDGHEMVLVPTGCFRMGDSLGDDDELPAEVECIREPFWIDVTEVTNEEYGSIGCEQWSSESDQPRNCITWSEALIYCQARDGSLPTELQWEYAARGVESWAYPWGNTLLTRNVAYENKNEVIDNRTLPVGSIPVGASWVGALDMAGNVSEWVSSAYEAYPYRIGDGREDLTNTSARHILRGGSSFSSIDNLRSADRVAVGNAGLAMSGVGFRCVLPIDAAQ